MAPLEAVIRPRDPIDPEASTTRMTQEADRPVLTLARQSTGSTWTAIAGRFGSARRDLWCTAAARRVASRARSSGTVVRRAEM